LFENLPVKYRNMIRCKLLASFYANKEGAASPKKNSYLYTFILKRKLLNTIC
jgi:hypothetical protein